MSTVLDLVGCLIERFPFEWAEDWDRVGLLAGDPDATVSRVFVTLDATLASLEAARAAGANVLLTHHPAFLDALETVTADSAGAAVAFQAVAAGIALVNCHTNLDRAPDGADALPAALVLPSLGPLEAEGDDPSMPRAGRICALAPGWTLASLAAHVKGRLGGAPRVWGRAESPIARVGIAPGGGGSLVEAAIDAGCDVLLTGELRYHGALAALDRGLLVIEAGHDATEWPLVRVLADTVATAAGFGPESVVLDPPAYRWWTA